MAELTLATAIEDIPYGTPHRDQFESDFKTDVAARMDGVTAENVEILEIRSASVVVTFAIIADTAETAAAAVENFAAAVQSAAPTIAGAAIATFGVVGADTEESPTQCVVLTYRAFVLQRVLDFATTAAFAVSLVLTSIWYRRCGVDARKAILECAPKRWDGFPFGTDGSEDFRSCRYGDR